MFSSGYQEKEIIILKTLNGPITVNLTKSSKGKLRLSINAPREVKIYREDMSING